MAIRRTTEGNSRIETFALAAGLAAIGTLAAHLPAETLRFSLRTTFLEAESWIDRAQSSEAPPSIQAMAPFGAGWGGDAQLFWAPERGGAMLRLQPSSPLEGEFDVVLVVTTAPDYGRFEASLDGRAPIAVDGYAPAVGRREIALGSHRLGRGDHELLLRITGRNPGSAGLRVGIDRLILTRVERPASRAPATGPAAGPPAPLRPGAIGSRSATVQPVPVGRLVGSLASVLPRGASLRALRPGLSVCEDPSLCYAPGTLLFVPPDAPDPRVRFEWDVSRVPRAAGVVWQVSRRPFPAGSPLTPADALTSRGVVAGVRGGFTVDAALAGSATTDAELPALFVRVVPVLAADGTGVAGLPSETLQIARARSSSPPVRIRTVRQVGPDLAITGFEWVPLVVTPRWPPGCSDEPEEKDLLETVVEAVEDTWSWATEAYADLKSAVVDVVAFVVPVVPRDALAIALDGALIAAGIPPDLPDLDRLLTDGADLVASELAAQIPVPEGITGVAVEALREQVRQESRAALLAAADELRRQAAAAHADHCITKVDYPILRVRVRNDGREPVESWSIRLEDDAVPPLYLPRVLPVTRLAPGESRVFPIPLADPRDWNVIPGPRSQMPDYDRGRDREDWWKRATAASLRFRITTDTGRDCLEGSRRCHSAGVLELFASPRRAWWGDAKTPWSWLP